MKTEINLKKIPGRNVLALKHNGVILQEPYASQSAQGMMGVKGENRWLKAKIRVWFCNLKSQRINSCLENTSNIKVPDTIHVIFTLRNEIRLKLIPLTFALRILSAHDL